MKPSSSPQATGSRNVRGIIDLGLVLPGRNVSGSIRRIPNLVVDEHTEILARMMSSGLTISHIVFEFTNTAPVGDLAEASVTDSATYYASQPASVDFIIAPLISQPLFERISASSSKVTFTATTASASGHGIFGTEWGSGSYLTHLGLLASDSKYGSGRLLFSRTRVDVRAISKPTGLDLCAHWEITFEQP